MKAVFNQVCTGLFLMLLSAFATAEVMDITLKFEPSAADPQNNKFVNTTPISGHCAGNNYCGEHFSVLSGITIAERELLRKSESSDQRYWNYQRLDAQFKSVQLRHVNTGETREVKFRINLISQNFYSISGPMNIDFNYSGVSPPPGCGGAVGTGNGNQYRFAWMHPEGLNQCVREFGESSITPRTLNVDQVSFGYEIISPEPLKMMNGIWEGTVSYSVGNNQQIDIGQGNYSDNVLTFNITATVKHHFNIERPPGSNKVILSPTGGWDKYINYGQLPPRLIRDVPLWVTSSGPFSVSMSCEHYSGPQCGIASALDGSIVPIRVGISLPGVESDGVPVNNLELGNRTRQPMETSRYNYMQLSHLHFSADSAAIQTMATQRGTPWRGAVTVIFDANL